jgi:hypothetical protein
MIPIQITATPTSIKALNIDSVVKYKTNNVIEAAAIIDKTQIARIVNLSTAMCLHYETIEAVRQ